MAERVVSTSKLADPTRPPIAVVVPNKGRAELCRAAIDSLQGQSLPDWEAIIVDDGSTPAELECIQAAIADDQRVRLILRDSPPAGANHCRNLGVDHARSDLIVFLDSDDMLSPGCLAARVAEMAKRQDLAFIVFPHEHFNVQPGDIDDPWVVPSEDQHLDRFLMGSPPWQTAGPTWRRSALKAVGPWDESLPCGQDWDFHVRALVLQLPHTAVPQPRFFHRITSNHRECVSNWALRSSASVHARLNMTAKACGLLRNSGLLTYKREQLLARLFLLTAEQLVQYGERSAASRWWGRALELGLISRRQYHEGKVLFRLHGIPILRSAFRLYARCFWPPTLRHHLTIQADG